ncbi:MAG: response regulator [Candidatus Methylomirabilales bacterium]
MELTSVERPPGKILVVDDDPKALEVLGAFLGEGELQVMTAVSGEEALRLAQEAPPDLIILDLVMPGMSGHVVLRELKSRKETSEIPVLIATALDQMAEKEKAIQGGADDFLTKPVNQRELLIRVRTLLKVKHLHRDLERTLRYLHELETARYAGASSRESPSRDSSKAPPSHSLSAKILIVEDENLERVIYADLLRDQGYQVFMVPTAPQALELLRNQTVDVILADIVLPGMSGLELIERLKTVAPGTPVIVVTAHPSSHNAITALKLGAFDFIVKGFKNEVMLHAVKQALEKRELELQYQNMLHEIKTKVDRLLEGHA